MVPSFSRCVFCLAALYFIGLPVRADKLVLVAGGGSGGDGAEAVTAALRGPFGVDFDKADNLYLVEMVGQRVCRVDGKGIFHVLAGTGKKGSGGDGGPAAKAEFNGMHSLAIAPNGDLFIADTWNQRIRKLDLATGLITAFAGSGSKGFGGDSGPASDARFGDVYCLAFDSRGDHLYVADLDNRRIRAIDRRTMIVRTVAGNGEKGVPKDGAVATQAPLVDPRAVAVDDQGNVYILERGGHALRVVDRSGKIRTVAGTGKQGNTGDGGDARQATLNGPKHLCIDRARNVVIADTENHRIRLYLPAEGKIIALAGTGKKGNAGLEGPPERAELAQPHGVFVHPKTGVLYIADSSNERVVKVVN